VRGLIGSQSGQVLRQESLPDRTGYTNSCLAQALGYWASLFQVIHSVDEAG